jgi:hypothetical protein
VPRPAHMLLPHTASVPLIAPDGRAIPESLLHIDGGNACWQRSYEPFPAEGSRAVTTFVTHSSAACRARSTRVFLPGSYAMRAPRLWMFPSGARKVSQVQVPSDSGSPSSSAPPWASSASPDPGRPPRAAGLRCRRGCGSTRSSGGRGRIAGSCRRSRRPVLRCSPHRRQLPGPGSRRRTGPAA